MLLGSSSMAILNTNKDPIKSITTGPFFNVMILSVFWSLFIFESKLSFKFGAEVLSFQLISILFAFSVLSIITLPKFYNDIVFLFYKQKDLFWKLFSANFIDALGNSLGIIGIALTSAINAGFLVKVATVTTIIFARIILKERLSGLKIITVFTMLAGAYLLTTKGQNLTPRIGDIIILCACVCWSLGNVLIRKYLITDSVRVEVVTFLKPLAGLPVILVLVAFSIWYPLIFGQIEDVMSCCNPPMSALPYTLLNGFFLAMIWIYLNRTLKVSSASYMTMMTMLVPVFVSLLAMLFLDESLTWIQIVGSGMIIMSGVMTYFSGISNE